jgi:molybdopterin molybdotransferase
MSRKLAATTHNQKGSHANDFGQLTPISEALRIVFGNLPKTALGMEKVPLSSAIGRILAEDVVSPVDIPIFEKSTKDGYAVIADDTNGATSTAPVLLRIVGAVSIGTIPKIRITRGEAASVVTGGQLPQGANAVVMVEYTKEHEDATVEISDKVESAENVTRIGEDVRKGSTVLRKGTRLLPQDVGMLTYLGLKHVTAVSKLKVAVLSTGSELAVHPVPSSGKIPDVNRPTLISALWDLDCEPIDLGIVPDDFDQIRSKLKQGIKKADLVLVTAGTSVGPRDMVPEIINSLARPGMLVHGVAMRPAMPTGLAVVDRKPVVSLPGFPVSAYVAFLELVQPLINFMLGTNPMPRPVVKAKLRKSIRGEFGTRVFARVLVTTTEAGYVAEPVKASSAAILNSLVQANGFVVVAEDIEGYEEGQEVDVELFRPPWPRQHAD